MALQEVDQFLGEVGAVLTEIPTLLQSIQVDIERVLLSAEWLLRDVACQLFHTLELIFSLF